MILPSLVTAFGTFFMRQYLVQALPTELIEAARVDGASSLRIVWHVVFPAARPAMAVLGLLTFVFAWNDFLWPIIALNQQNPTVQVALNSLGTGYVPDQAVIMAGALLGTLPLLVAFLLFGKQIVGGIMQGRDQGLIRPSGFPGAGAPPSRPRPPLTRRLLRHSPVGSSDPSWERFHA